VLGKVSNESASGARWCDRHRALNSSNKRFRISTSKPSQKRIVPSGQLPPQKHPHNHSQNASEASCEGVSSLRALDSGDRLRAVGSTLQVPTVASRR
jgi:hypothetical protein